MIISIKMIFKVFGGIINIGYWTVYSSNIGYFKHTPFTLTESEATYFKIISRDYEWEFWTRKWVGLSGSQFFTPVHLYNVLKQIVFQSFNFKANT